MESKHKEQYENPSTDVVEVKTEGVICESGGAQDYTPNTLQEW